MEKGSDGNADIPAEVLKQSIAAAPCGFVVTDYQQKDNPVVFVNQAFERITGYKAGEVLGKNCRFLLGKDRDQGPLEQVRGAVGRGRRCTVVLRNYRKDGTLFYNELSVAPMRNRSRDVMHLIWLQRDVTAQIGREEKMVALIAEKEERFSAYMENANEAIWRIDFEPPIPLDAPESRQIQMIFDNGVFSEANDAVAHTYGLTRGKEVIDRPLRKFMEQSDPKNVEKMVEFVQKKFHVNNLVTYEKVYDGTTSIIVNNIIPCIQDGKVQYIWGASLEISELFEAQQDLERSREELALQKKALEEKNAALKELIAHIELDKKELKDRIQANVEQVIIPSLDKIRLNKGSDAHIEQLRKALENLTSSFGRKVADSRVKLTPREIEVCNMVKNGLTSKEIAGLLSIALHTVEKHRRMARAPTSIRSKAGTGRGGMAGALPGSGIRKSMIIHLWP
jgi:PAS domain S-box-containing protein